MSAAITAAVVGIAGGAILSNNKPKATQPGGSLSSTQDPTQTASDLMNAYQNSAPGMYNLANQYAPQYNQLQQNNLNSQQANLVNSYATNTGMFQGIQNQANQIGAAGNVGLLGAFGGQAQAAYMGMNPQLAQLQGQYTNMAMSGQNPVGMLGQQGGWGQQFNQQAGQMVNGAQVSAMQNPTLNALQAQAQQQLALGSSMSDQQAKTVSSQVLANYNTMGRAEDPTAIAGLATGLDTYGQQLLQQREQNASNVAGLGNQYAGMQLSGQQSNLGSQLGLAGLQYEGLYGSGQQQLQGGMANQNAQLSNANYQNQLMQGASNLAYTTGQNPYNMLMQQSGAFGNMSNMLNQAGQGATQGQQYSNMYNPFASNFNSVYGTQTGANAYNANTNAGLMSGLINGITSPTGIGAIKSVGTGIGNIFTPSSQPPPDSTIYNGIYTGSGSDGGDTSSGGFF